VQSYDVIIIGAGHNGLVAAAYLGKAGRKVLLLEKRPVVGGIAATEEVFAGFKYETCAHSAGMFSRSVLAELDLAKFGLDFIVPDAPLVALNRDGEPLSIPADPRENAAGIRGCSGADGARLDAFARMTARLALFLGSLYTVPLPDGARSDTSDLIELLKAGWRFHRLDRKEMHEFLRVLPMSVSDWLNEWFDGVLLKAALARSGVLGTFAGPRAQGTSLVFLHRHLGAIDGLLPAGGSVRGGIGNLPQAIAHAASHYGVEIRTGTEASAIIVKNGRATGVALSNGDEFPAPVIISATDVKRTLLKLTDPVCLNPRFLWQVKNIRSRGTLAKVNFALDTLPDFGSIGAPGAQAFRGVVHIGPTVDYLERAADDAKYGRISSQPFLEIRIPSIADPSLAPAGKHVMSVWMQSAPYHLRSGNWRDQRESLGKTVVNLIDEYAPGFKNTILHQQVLTPLDLEEIFGLTEGHVHHAEMALDQLFFMRPVPGWARYRTPIHGLYLCGSGTHPGGEISGLPGSYAAKEILKRPAG
jgi:phytoene dehydrogenase-like protein